MSKKKIYIKFDQALNGEYENKNEKIEIFAACLNGKIKGVWDFENDCWINNHKNILLEIIVGFFVSMIIFVLLILFLLFVIYVTNKSL